MQPRTPFFLLGARDILVFILFVIGLALLIIYGSQAIAGASQRKYVEGWQNRPFKSSPVTRSEHATTSTLQLDTSIQHRPIIEVNPHPKTQPDKQAQNTASQPTADEPRHTTKRQTKAKARETPTYQYSIQKLFESLGL